MIHLFPALETPPTRSGRTRRCSFSRFFRFIRILFPLSVRRVPFLFVAVGSWGRNELKRLGIVSPRLEIAQSFRWIVLSLSEFASISVYSLLVLISMEQPTCN